jgi:tol-pal system protein YbgF
MLRFFIFISLLILVTGCATPQDLQNLQSRVSQLERGQKQILNTTQNRVQNLEQKFASLEKETSHLVSNRTESMRSHQADLWSEFENMRVNVATLQGKMEQAAYNISTLQSQDKEHSQHIKDMQQTLQRLDRQMDVLGSQLGLDLEGQQASSAQSVGTKKKDTEDTANTPQLLYENALNAFHSREYDQAKELWAEFAGQFPEHELAPNAYFWQAECLYQMNEYAQAVLLYDKVISQYPDSSKYTSALLKQGLSLYALNKNKAGRIRLQQLIKDYPDTAEAKRAQTFLEQR